MLQRKQTEGNDDKKEPAEGTESKYKEFCAVCEAQTFWQTECHNKAISVKINKVHGFINTAVD